MKIILSTKENKLAYVLGYCHAHRYGCKSCVLRKSKMIGSCDLNIKTATEEQLDDAIKKINKR